MASAVTVIFGANSTQFQAELARMQALAAASGRRIGGSMAGGHIPGQTGIVRESAVIGREIAMGRGMGRILASMTLLAQYMNTANRNAGQGVSAAGLMADAYEKMAVKARLAAIAALKKAEASAVAAEMDGFENAESIAVADANAAEAKEAESAAAALEAKALAASNSAEADAAAAGAAVTAGGAFKALLGSLGFFALLLVIIAEAYIAFTALAKIINRKSVADKEAADYAREHKLAIWEEIEAMEKLKDASENFTQALIKMNVAKDRSVELAREAVEAFKMEAEAKAKLYDAGVKGKLLDIDIAEKTGLISKRDAILQKAAIESQAVADKAAAKQATLDGEAELARDAAAKAEKDKADAQAAAQAANDKINKSPEGMKRAEMLAAAEKDLSASKSAAAEAQKTYDDEKSKSWLSKTGEWIMQNKKPLAGLKEESDAKTNAAASAELRVNSLKRFMKPDEIAAGKAMSVAEERTGSALTLKEEARKTATAADINRKYSPGEVAAEQADIEKKKTLDITPPADVKGYSINSAQKIGAYAATAPILLQQLTALRSIDSKVTPIRPTSNHPPGERKPQLSPAPQSTVNGNVFSFPRPHDYAN